MMPEVLESVLTRLTLTLFTVFAVTVCCIESQVGLKLAQIYKGVEIGDPETCVVCVCVWLALMYF